MLNKFNKLNRWIKLYRDCSTDKAGCIVVIVGNKSDLLEERLPGKKARS